jgi:DTW domain-containing protein YfiP
LGQLLYWVGLGWVRLYCSACAVCEEVCLCLLVLFFLPLQRLLLVVILPQHPLGSLG